MQPINKIEENIMSEKSVIEKTKLPVTIDSLYKGLRELGINTGDVVLMHSSLSSLGWVCGGAQTVIMAGLRSLEFSGTLVMPSHSGDWSDPINWKNPPVPEEWVPIIRENMPAFNKDLTPTRGIGRVAELFRTYPGVYRSNHPLLSFSAIGVEAENITKNHPLTPQLGKRSPLGKLYELNAKVLLLGVGYESCTSFHLAESMIKKTPRMSSGTAINKDGKRQWITFKDFDYNSDDFEKLGIDFEKTNPVSTAQIGNAQCRLFNMKTAVDFAKPWLLSNRF